MKVLKWILTGILVALLIAAGFAYFQGYRIATVVSGSMEPTIMTGSIVVIDSNEIDPEVGDIICYQQYAEKSFIIAVSICTDTQICLTEILRLKDRIKNGLLISHTSKQDRDFCTYQLLGTCMITALLHTKLLKNKP